MHIYNLLLCVLFGFAGYGGGRNTYRRDYHLIEIVIFTFIATALLCVGLPLKQSELVYYPVSYFIGFIFGLIVLRHVKAHYNNSPDGDRVMNRVYDKWKTERTAVFLGYVRGLEAAPRRRMLMLMFTNMVVLYSLLGICIWFVSVDMLGYLLRKNLVHAGDGTVYLIPTEQYTTLLPVLMVCICLFVVFSEFVLPLMAGKWKEQWLRYAWISNTNPISNIHKQLDKKLCLWLSVGAVAVSVVGLVLSADNYVRVKDSGVEINSYWGLGSRFYKWSEVSKVDMIPGLFNSTTETHVCFVNGDEWTPNYTLTNHADEYLKAVRYIAKRAQGVR